MRKIMQGISVLIVLFAVLTVPVVADSPPTIICQATIDSFDVRNVAVDSNDNIILSGHEHIAKFDSACNELWTIEREDKDFDDVAVDPDGNIIAVYNRNYDIIICKYTPSGAESWCKQYDFNGWGWRDSPEAVAVDSNGDIIVVGQASERELPRRDLWIVIKVSGTTKNVLWTDYFEHDPPGGAVCYAVAEDVVIDSNDYVIVTGSYDHLSGFYDDRQMLTIKYEPNGDRYCTKPYGAVDYCWGCSNYAYTVTVDHQDNIIIGGQSERWDDHNDGDVIKYSSNCRIQWEKALGMMRASAITSDDGIIMATSRIYLLDSTNGDVIWSLGFSAGDVAVDSADNIIAVNSGEIVKYGYAQPDLTITRIWFNENPCCAGDDIEIIFGVTNQGDCDAGSHTDCLYIDGNKVMEFPSSGLNAGQTQTWYYLYSNVPSTPDPHVIQVCADCNDDVEESDNDNNCDSDNLDVVTPIMTVNPTSWNPTILCGNTDSAIVTVSASGGTVEGVTVSKISGETWLTLSQTNLGDIPSGSSETFTVTAAPPAGTSSGDYPYTIRVSNTCGTPSTRDVSGTIHVKPPSETVVSIEDASAPQGETVTVPVNIADVENMCGANIWLNYEKDVVIVDSVSDGDLVPLTHNIDNTAGVTKMNWDTTSGMTGDFVFAYVTLKAVGNPGDTCLLDLDVKELYDCDLVEIPRTVVDGTFEVIAPLMEGDVTDLNVCVSLKDSTLIKFYLVDMATLTPDQLECADTNDDGEVTLKDSTAIKFWLVDQYPLWESPADDHMMEPVPCSAMSLARTASATESIEDASVPAKCSLLFVAGGEPIEKKKACSCYPQKERIGEQEKVGGNKVNEKNNA